MRRCPASLLPLLGARGAGSGPAAWALAAAVSPARGSPPARGVRTVGRRGRRAAEEAGDGGGDDARPAPASRPAAGSAPPGPTLPSSSGRTAAAGSQQRPDYGAMLRQLERQAGVDKVEAALAAAGGAGASYGEQLEAAMHAVGMSGGKRGGSKPTPSPITDRASRRLVDTAASALGFDADAAISSAARRARAQVTGEASLRDAILSGQGGSVRDGILSGGADGGGPPAAARRAAQPRQPSVTGRPSELAQLLAVEREAASAKQAQPATKPGRGARRKTDIASGGADRLPAGLDPSFFDADGGAFDFDALDDAEGAEGVEGTSGDSDGWAQQRRVGGRAEPATAAGGRRGRRGSAASPTQSAAAAADDGGADAGAADEELIDILAVDGTPVERAQRPATTAAPQPMQASPQRPLRKDAPPAAAGGRRKRSSAASAAADESDDVTRTTGRARLERLLGLNEDDAAGERAAGSSEGSAGSFDDGYGGGDGLSGSDERTAVRGGMVRRPKSVLFAYSSESDHDAVAAAGARGLPALAATGDRRRLQLQQQRHVAALPAPLSSSSWDREEALEGQLADAAVAAREAVAAAQTQREADEDALLAAVTAAAARGGRRQPQLAPGGGIPRIGDGGGTADDALATVDDAASAAEAAAAAVELAARVGGPPSVRASAFEGVLAQMDELRGSRIPDDAVPETAAWKPAPLGPDFTRQGAPESVQRGMAAVQSLRGRSALLTAQRLAAELAPAATGGGSGGTAVGALGGGGDAAVALAGRLTPEAASLAVERARAVEAHLRGQLTLLDIDAAGVDDVTLEALQEQARTLQAALEINRASLLEELAPAMAAPSLAAAGRAFVTTGALGSDADSAAASDGIDIDALMAGRAPATANTPRTVPPATTTTAGGRVIDAHSSEVSTTAAPRALSSFTDADFDGGAAPAAAAAPGNETLTVVYAAASSPALFSGDDSDGASETSLAAMAQASARALDDASRGLTPASAAAGKNGSGATSGVLDDASHQRLGQVLAAAAAATATGKHGGGALAARDDARPPALASLDSFAAAEEAERRSEERALLREVGVGRGGSAASPRVSGDGIRGTSSYTGVGTLQERLAAEKAASDARRRTPARMSKGELDDVLRAKAAALDAVDDDSTALARYLIDAADGEDAKAKGGSGALAAKGKTGDALAAGGANELDSDGEDGSGGAPRSLLPPGYRSWAEVATALATKPKRLTKAKAQLAADQAAKLKLMIKPPTPRGGAPPSPRQVRVQAQVGRVLTALLARRAVRDPGLYPGGSPVEVTDVTVTADLRTAHVRWVLPVPLVDDAGSRGSSATAPQPLWDAAVAAARDAEAAALPVGRKAQQRARREAAAQALAGGLLDLGAQNRRAAGASAASFDAATGDDAADAADGGGGAPREYAMDASSTAAALMAGIARERDARTAKRAAAAAAALPGAGKTSSSERALKAYGDDGRTDHLPPHAAALAAATASALQRHVRTLTRLVGVEMGLQWVPRLEFHRHVSAELAALGAAGVDVSRYTGGSGGGDDGDERAVVTAALASRRRPSVPAAAAPAPAAAGAHAPASGWRRVGMSA